VTKWFVKSLFPKFRFAKATVFALATASSYPMTHVAFQVACVLGWRLSRSQSHNQHHLRHRKLHPKMMGAEFSETRTV
jgi:hypothetical protein